MTITILTSRELGQNVGRAKRAAHSGPVFITNRGRPTHVLLNVEDYRRLAGAGRGLAESLSRHRASVRAVSSMNRTAPSAAPSSAGSRPGNRTRRETPRSS